MPLAVRMRICVSNITYCHTSAGHVCQWRKKTTSIAVNAWEFETTWICCSLILMKTFQKFTHLHALDIGRKPYWTLILVHIVCNIHLDNLLHRRYNKLVCKMHERINVRTVFDRHCIRCSNCFRFLPLWISITSVAGSFFFSWLHMSHRCIYVCMSMLFSWVQLRASSTTADTFLDIYWMNACDLCADCTHSISSTQTFQWRNVYCD